MQIQAQTNGIILTCRNQFTGTEAQMHLPITAAQYYRSWKDWRIHGKLIQHAFPTLTPEQREFIKTGITPEQWARIFPPSKVG